MTPPHASPSPSYAARHNACPLCGQAKRTDSHTCLACRPWGHQEGRDTSPPTNARARRRSKVCPRCGGAMWGAARLCRNCLTPGWSLTPEVIRAIQAQGVEATAGHLRQTTERVQKWIGGHRIGNRYLAQRLVSFLGLEIGALRSHDTAGAACAAGCGRAVPQAGETCVACRRPLSREALALTERERLLHMPLWLRWGAPRPPEVPVPDLAHDDDLRGLAPDLDWKCMLCCREVATLPVPDRCVHCGGVIIRL